MPKIADYVWADAVYISWVRLLDSRAKAKNFSMKDMEEGIALLMSIRSKSICNSNILAHNEDLKGVREYF